ncbi:hypothetical protein CAPTEDRAFT_211387 [Capitella teleta]|uniref:Uncharacterized protein n=1 Tax=Capitella teleta TaxID=283909 RepID=R7UIG2_CAPTE|nr:hypothetical protein CAPTEDRAFT_211387 [Capitella teleta]|eukprot:ELU06354.1 hypothetical protein CAPTEDRAFT_211387 [Capitella teleta]
MAEHQEALLYLQRELEEVQGRLAQMNQQQQEQHPAAVVFPNHLLRDREERAVSREAQRISQCDEITVHTTIIYFKVDNMKGATESVQCMGKDLVGTPIRLKCFL